MYDHMRSALQKAEAVSSQGVNEALGVLRNLPVEDFVHCIYHPPSEYRKLFDLLPQLPDAQTQRDYVGNDGATLEQMTSAFIRSLSHFIHRRFDGGFPSDGRILDYGCGWGRLLRMMTYFADADNLFGADPLERSLLLCKTLRVPGRTALCEPIPKCVPFEPVQFDLVYAFSVFTHLSEEAARAVLSAVRDRISSRGMFVLTIRPYEFWDVVAPKYHGSDIARVRRDHMADRYAFLPSEQFRYNGRETFGDTSLSMRLLSRLGSETGWLLDPAYDRSLIEPYQIVFALYPS